MNNDVAINNIVIPDEPPVERELSDFIYESVNASSFINVNAWSEFFDAIPVDPYIKDGYRYKAIAWFRIKHSKVQAIKEIDERILTINKLSGMNADESNRYTSNSEPTWKSKETGYECWNLPQYAMQQSIQYNPIHGDMRREYPRISESIVNSEDFHRLLIHYASFFRWSDAIVLAQFQRVDCFVNRKGQPTVEGFHQDGNRHVGMLIVNRNNITNDSGVSQYVMDDNGKKQMI